MTIETDKFGLLQRKLVEKQTFFDATVGGYMAAIHYMRVRRPNFRDKSTDLHGMYENIRLANKTIKEEYESRKQDSMY